VGNYVFANTEQSLLADFLEKQNLGCNLLYYIVDTVNILLQFQGPSLVSLAAFVNPLFVITIGNDIVTFGQKEVVASGRVDCMVAGAWQCCVWRCGVGHCKYTKLISLKPRRWHIMCSDNAFFKLPHLDS
jgi:hypothetical protein